MNTTSKIKVSVLIPVYNEEENISKCIESILKQKINFNIEIIIVNDCSTDNTLAIAQKYAKKHPNVIKVISNTSNLGEGKTSAKALKAAQGEYFHVLDADDHWCYEYKLQKQVDFLEKNPQYNMAAHNTLKDDAKSKQKIKVVTDKSRVKSPVTYKAILSGDIYFHTSSVLFRNVYKNKIPKFLNARWGFGDSIRMIIHSFNGYLKYFDEVWSVYNYTGHGIWSSLPPEQQLKDNLTASLFWFKITPISKKIYSWLCVAKYALLLAKYEKSKHNNIFYSMKYYLLAAHAAIMWGVFYPKILGRALKKIGKKLKK